MSFFKLSRLFQVDALTDWTLCYEEPLIFLCVTEGLLNVGLSYSTEFVTETAGFEVLKCDTT